MKVICGILSVLGLYWACTAWGYFLLLARIVFDGADVGFRGFASVVVASILVTFGYWIWTGWIVRLLNGRYHRTSPRVFWTVSLVQHAGWLILLFMPDGPGLDWDWGAPLLWWNVILIAVSLIGILIEGRHPSTQTTKAEQVGAPNP
jgi:hypothetical protein